MRQVTTVPIDSASSEFLELMGEGWLPVDGKPIIRTDGRFSARAVGLAGSRPVVLCEGKPADALPTHAKRREWRVVLDAIFGEEAIVVFTDPAHSHAVWSCRREGDDRGRLVEWHVPPRSGLLREVARTRFRSLPSLVALTGSDQEQQLVVWLCDALGSRSGSVVANLEALIAAIDDEEEPERLRSVWRALTRIVVLDTRCGHGTWLLTAATLLEAIHNACIDRIRGVVDDQAIHRESAGRRPEYLRDLRSIVDLSIGPFGGGSTERFVRRLIVQRALHGFDSDAVGVRRCRNLLLDYAELPRDGGSYLDANIRRWNGSAVDPRDVKAADLRDPTSRKIRVAGTERRRWDRSRGGSENGGGQVRPSWLQEEARLIGRGFEILRQQRLTLLTPRSELKCAGGDLERRRRSLLRIAREVAGSGAGGVVSMDLLYPWLSARSARILFRGLDPGE